MQGWMSSLRLSWTKAAKEHICTSSELRSTLSYDTSPGSGQQTMATEEQGTWASLLQCCCCPASQPLAICSQGTSQGRSTGHFRKMDSISKAVYFTIWVHLFETPHSAAALGVQLKTHCSKVAGKWTQTWSFQSGLIECFLMSIWAGKFARNPAVIGLRPPQKDTGEKYNCRFKLASSVSIIKNNSTQEDKRTTKLLTVHNIQIKPPQFLREIM